MTASPRIRSGLIVISASALVVSAGLYAYLYHDTLALTEHAIAARASVQAEAERQKVSKDILALASSTAAARARLGTLFVPADDAVAFIQSVESVGSASGATVAISAISASLPDGAKPGTIGTITAHVSVSGSWSGVMRALELLEDLPYRSSVEKVSLATSIPAGDRGSQGVRAWTASVDLSASTLK